MHKNYIKVYKAVGNIVHRPV